MDIQRNLCQAGGRAVLGAQTRPFSAGLALILLIVAVFTAGCGGSSSKNKNIVAQVNISPATASLVAGQVITVSASASNSAGNAVTTTFTFNSSNTAIATVSPSGQICGGVWDSTFVLCNGTDSSGNPVTGNAVVTATAGGVTSGPISVSVHPSVTSVTVDPVSGSGCFSHLQTNQFKAHALHNGTDITNLVGDFTWSISDSSVATVDSNGLATARIGGIASVVASVGNTTSPATPFRTCMPVDIILHLAGDPASGFTFLVALNAAETKAVQVDAIDENGVATPTAPITIFSNNPAVATMSGTTVTAQSPGGAGLQAVCAPPTCGNGINTPIYSNVFSVTVNGTSPTSTTVYAASAFPVPTGKIMPLLPIDISKTPPVAGAALPLPGVPNSIVFDPSGVRAYIGTNGGLAVLDTTANTVTLASPTPVGKVLAVSNDGTKAIISNAANNPATGTPIEPVAANQRIWIFDHAANTVTTFIASGAVAAAFDTDGFKAFIFGNNGNLYVFSPRLTFQTLSIGGTTSAAIPLPSGPFVYAAQSGGLKAVAVCNNTLQAGNVPTNSTNIQLVSAPKHVDQIIAVESTGVDVITVNVTPPTPPVNLTPANCAPNVTYSNTFLDFGLGPFTANQVLVGSDNLHVAVLPAGINKVLTVVPGGGIGSAQLAAGGTQALSGGLTPDGATLWVGVAGSNTVDRINLGSNVDEVQVQTNFVKDDGTPAPPNLVAIKPK